MDEQPLPAPTPDETTLAMLAHLLPFVASIFGPLVIYLAKRESQFVRFHALQALLFHLLYIVTVGFLIAAFMVSALFSSVAFSGRAGPSLMIFVLPCFVAPLGIAMLICLIVFAVKAGRGEWAEYPVVGPWARRIVSRPR